MKLIADCHFHTISSGHAFSTICEYAKEASEGPGINRNDRSRAPMPEVLIYIIFTI